MGISKKKPQNREVERFTLNSTQATNQEVFLAKTPKNQGSVTLDLPNGSVQILGFDYDVSGNRVFWDGFALETLLAEGDKIIITYS